MGELRQVMDVASEEVVGRALPSSSEGMGLDEIDADKVEDLRDWRNERVIRCNGYLERKKAWEERVGRV